MRSIKEECLDRLIPIGERHFRRAVAEYVEHYHGERNHQGLGNRLISGSPVIADDESRATPFAARRVAQLLSASGVIVRSAENWNNTRASEKTTIVPRLPDLQVPLGRVVIRPSG